MTPWLLAVIYLFLGSVEGRVTFEGTPVAGAQVTVEGLGRSVRTSRAGAFRLDSIPDGRWRVAVRAQGYVDGHVTIRIEGGATAHLDFELERREGGGPVYGAVLEAGRLEPVHFALVEIVGFGRSTVSDEDGLFSLGGAPADSFTIRVSAPGYAPLERHLGSGPAASGVELYLTPQPVELAGLLVRGGQARVGARADAPGALVVDSALVSLVPTVVERDVLRTVQVLPSVTPGSDLNGAPYVRGGTPGQTPIVLDGVRLHNPYHLGGFVSSFEPSAVDAAVLRPGGLPASEAGGLSGALEVHTRDGDRDSVRVNGGIGILSSAVTVSGPWNKGSFLLSGRRTYIDLGSSVAQGLGLVGSSFPYRFWDLLGKATLDLGGRDRSLTFSSYLNREGFHDNGGYEGAWGSDAVGMRFRGLVRGGATLDAGVSTSGFAAHVSHIESGDSLVGLVTSDLRGNVRSWAADAKVQMSSGGHVLSAGSRLETNSVSHALNPRGGVTGLFAPFRERGRFGTAAVFVRDRWKISEGLALDAGVRAARPRGRKWTLLPRARLELGLGETSSVAVSGGAYLQDWWSLRNEEGVAASIVGYDLPVPIPEGRPLARAWDAVLEARTQWAGWTVRVDAFHKRLRDVPTSPVVANPSDTPVTFAPDSVRIGRQQTDGVELFATGTLWDQPIALSYRFERNRGVLDGVSFIPRRARTHRLVLNGRRHWGEREVAFALTWMSGRRYTPALGYLPPPVDDNRGGRLADLGLGGGRVLLGEPNGKRLPSYLRLDLDFRGAWDLKLFGREGSLEPYVSVLNVLGRNNALSGHYIAGRDQLLLEVIPELPVLPSFGVRWRF